MKRALAFIVCVVIAIACASPPSDAIVVATVPDRASFPVVADLLEKRCGTLDCHGSSQRNLRVYGSFGLRLAQADRPISKGQTTIAEYDETYRSIVALEPEILSAVINDGGAHPERLTFVRKARGTENHKGNSLMTEGDAEDACITSWLAGKTDQAGCVAAKEAAF